MIGFSISPTHHVEQKHFPLIIRKCFKSFAPYQNFILENDKLGWKLKEIIHAVHAEEQTAIMSTAGMTKMNERRIFNSLAGLIVIITLTH